MNECMHAMGMHSGLIIYIVCGSFPYGCQPSKAMYVVRTLPDAFANCCRPAPRQSDRIVCAPPGEFSLMPWVVENSCLGKWLILTAFLPWAEWILRIRFKVGELRVWDGDPVLSDGAVMTVMASCWDQLTVNVRVSQLAVPPHWPLCPACWVLQLWGERCVLCACVFS